MFRPLELTVAGHDAPAAALLALRLDAVRYAADGINLYELVAPDGAPLPPFAAGAHIDLHLPGGLVRQYSLCNPQSERHRYVVAVKRDANSRGGSRHMHDALRVGTVLQVGAPRNNFPLHEDGAASVFIAGGIGITPMVCMVDRVRTLGRPWQLHYAVRRRGEAAFVRDLAGDNVHLHVDEEHGGAPLDVAAIVRAAPAEAHLYCCGPAAMLDAFEAAATVRPAGFVHLERFTPRQAAAVEGGFTVRLARCGREIRVPPGQTILEALRGAGVEVPASCEQGICGTCETRVLGGAPEHRDSLLSPDERAANNVMMICCSGSKQDLLVLDL